MPRRIAILLSVAAVVLAINAGAQIAPDTYRIGNKKIYIPAPDGFSSVAPRFPRLFERFVSTESRDNRVLQVHVEESLLGRLSVNENAELHFYTKVSAPREPITLDEAQFGLLVKQFESQVGGFFDPESPELSAVVADIQKALSKHNRETSNFALSGAKDLGAFDRQSTVFSHMVLLSVESQGGPIPLVATSSLLVLDGQLVFVYTYRRLTEVMDAEALRDFTKKWTNEILSANETTAASLK